MSNGHQQEDEEEFAEDWDFSDGFGGIPEDVDLTKNIGCASDAKEKSRLKADTEKEEENKKGAD